MLRANVSIVRSEKREVSKANCAITIKVSARVHTTIRSSESREVSEADRTVRIHVRAGDEDRSTRHEHHAFTGRTELDSTTSAEVGEIKECLPQGVRNAGLKRFARAPAEITGDLYRIAIYNLVRQGIAIDIPYSHSDVDIVDVTRWANHC